MENTSQITKRAFRARVNTPGQSWTWRAIVFVKQEGMTTEDALAHAKDRLGYFDDEQLELTELELYPTTAKLSVDNYPYGRLRTTAYHSVELSNKHGYRTVFQTINPKNGRINAPKKSVYTPHTPLLPGFNVENGHFDTVGYFTLDSFAKMSVAYKFYADVFELLTPDDVEYLALNGIAMMNMNSKFACGFGDIKINWDDLKPLVEPVVKTLVHISKTGENKFAECSIDLDAYKSLKEKAVAQVTA